MPSASSPRRPHRAAIDLVQISTNEVFDGRRAHDRGYRPDDLASPANPYGASKLAGEAAAAAAYRDGDANLAIVRTSWLFGPPGSDFPTKILAAAAASAAAASAERQPLKVVADEFGSPTFTHDLAEAVAAMLGADIHRGVRHIVNAGIASRADWASELFRQAGVDGTIEAVSMSDWTRASTPPAWGVLEPTEIPGVEPLRPWQQALADYLPLLRRQRTAAAAG